jgi:hypothetical protein
VPNYAIDPNCSNGCGLAAAVRKALAQPFRCQPEGE